MQAFDFDRVFGPEVQQAGIFQDVSQLVTSALDGYNVCIFAYGQTGKIASLSHGRLLVCIALPPAEEGAPRINMLYHIVCQTGMHVYGDASTTLCLSCPCMHKLSIICYHMACNTDSLGCTS